MTRHSILEDDLRAHFAAVADELRLDPIEFVDLDARRSTVVVRFDGRRSRRRTALVGAAAIVLAVLASAVVMWRPDERGSLGVAGAGSSPVAADPNTIAAVFEGVGAWLPSATPTGYRVNTVAATRFPNSLPTTVWIDCDGCEAPTGAVALVRRVIDPTVFDEAGAGARVAVEIDGREAIFTPASSANPTFALESSDGLEPGFGFYGWGVTLAQVEELARAYAVHGDEALAVGYSGGLVIAATGPSITRPGANNADAFAHLSYVDRSTRHSVNYLYAHSTDPVSNYSAMWELPNVESRSASGPDALAVLTSSAGDRSAVVVRPDRYSIVLIQTDDPAITVDDLLAMSLTKVLPTDPIWEHLLNEANSGQTSSGAPATTVSSVWSVPDTTILVCPLQRYVIQDGDSPASVAAQFDVDLSELTAANVGDPNYAAFIAGTEIVIPPAPDCASAPFST